MGLKPGLGLFVLLANVMMLMLLGQRKDLCALPHSSQCMQISSLAPISTSWYALWRMF